MYFQDRIDAGKQLADLLESYKDQEVVIYALPRGGVMVGAEVAKKLKKPFDLIITRKIGHPNQPEYAIGAISEKGLLILDQKEASKINQEYLLEESEIQLNEAKRRRKVYLGKREPVSCIDKIAIIVDDGIATGLTVEVAIKEVRNSQPKKIIVAVPVAPQEVIDKLDNQYQVEVISLFKITRDFGSVGSYYLNFPPITDKEVIEILKKSYNKF